MKYTPALGDKICRATAKSSIGLRRICTQLKVPYSTVTDWIYNPEHELHKKYMQAKQLQLHCLAQEVLEMVDDITGDYSEVTEKGKKKKVLNREHISRTRLRMQARIAIITKLAPVLYGTKPEKAKHKVIMPGPPAPSAPAPIHAPNETAKTPQPVPAPQPKQSTNKQINQNPSPKNPSKPTPIADRDEESRQAGIRAIEQFEHEQAQLREELHRWVNKY